MSSIGETRPRVKLIIGSRVMYRSRSPSSVNDEHGLFLFRVMDTDIAGRRDQRRWYCAIKELDHQVGESLEQPEN